MLDSVLHSASCEGQKYSKRSLRIRMSPITKTLVLLSVGGVSAYVTQGLDTFLRGLPSEQQGKDLYTDNFRTEVQVDRKVHWTIDEESFAADLSMICKKFSVMRPGLSTHDRPRDSDGHEAATPFAHEGTDAGTQTPANRGPLLLLSR